ncbi:MAG: arginine--tRNA ligase, partial [Fimbriimonadaceae bacterium]|nr:arginine--tRNA ligase [Fimbriimonadaceae bacterium]
MIRSLLTRHLADAVASLVAAGTLPPAEYGTPEIAEPKNPDHGDFACAFALTAAKQAGMNPRAIAEALALELGTHEAIAAVEIAGPGFLNLRLDPAWLGSLAAQVGAGFERSPAEISLKLNVEFVSVNPNGPITVGSGRGAAFGDTLCRVLEAAGHRVHREFYVNDGVNSEQMRLFAESVRHYVREAAGLASSFPEGGYKGDYVQEVAASVLAGHPDAAEKDVDWFQRRSQELMIARQKKDLADFGVEFDTWFSEQSLHEEDAVSAALEKLKADGVSFEKDGALWLRSTEYGDDKDRVLVRADGRPTYIASDIAYHENKFSRGFDKLIDIWGPDHHGYIGRMKAAVAAAGHRPEQFEVIIFQIVRFVKEGQPAPMRKRDGNIYSLRDLMDEIGKASLADDPDAEAIRLHGGTENQRVRGRDVARFFYLMRSHDTHMDFDID